MFSESYTLSDTLNKNKIKTCEFFVEKDHIESNYYTINLFYKEDKDINIVDGRVCFKFFNDDLKLVQARTFNITCVGLYQNHIQLYITFLYDSYTDYKNMFLYTLFDKCMKTGKIYTRYIKNSMVSDNVYLDATIEI